MKITPTESTVRLAAASATAASADTVSTLDASAVTFDDSASSTGYTDLQSLLVYLLTLVGDTTPLPEESAYTFSFITSAGGSENDAGFLYNVTTAGDAGNRADHFEGAALGGQWTSEATTATTLSVKYSNLGLFHATQGMQIMEPFTPSGAFRVEMRAWNKQDGAGSYTGLFVRDSGTGTGSGHGMMAFVDHEGLGLLYSLDAGTLNLRAAETAGKMFTGWSYLALERNGSNVWSAYISVDRNIWVRFDFTYAKTFTVAKMGIWVQTGYGGIDFIDVVS